MVVRGRRKVYIRAIEKKTHLKKEIFWSKNKKGQVRKNCQSKNMYTSTNFILTKKK
jgi:hypothetical protein